MTPLWLTVLGWAAYEWASTMPSLKRDRIFRAGLWLIRWAAGTQLVIWGSVLLVGIL